jgi:hypothetical protein
MKRTITTRSVLITFVVTLALYVCAYNSLQYLQTRKGPWEVNFATDDGGNPSITIYQPKLNISSVEILFLGERVAHTNLSERVAFDNPRKPTPFGTVIYDDLMFQPGVVTMDLFGHEVEFLPRTLIINKKEFPWNSDSTIELSSTNKPPIRPKPLQ